MRCSVFAIFVSVSGPVWCVGLMVWIWFVGNLSLKLTEDIRLGLTAQQVTEIRTDGVSSGDFSWLHATFTSTKLRPLSPICVVRKRGGSNLGYG